MGNKGGESKKDRMETIPLAGEFKILREPFPLKTLHIVPTQIGGKGGKGGEQLTFALKPCVIY